MADNSEVPTECVKSVKFSFFSDEDVRKISVKKITKDQYLDGMGRPEPGGLYDPHLGPLEETVPCKTCGQYYSPCHGHFGHVDLVAPVYNPLLFNILYNILHRTCFFCRHFRATRKQVETCVSQLELIAKGDIVGAKILEDDMPSETLYSDDSDGSQYDDVGHSRQQGWTSLQFTEATSVLKKFLKSRSPACKNCEAKNPAISKPTFGWFHMRGKSGDARQNVIRGHNLEGSFNGRTNKKALPEVENSNDTTPWSDVVDSAETDTASDTSPRAQDGATRKHGGKGGEVPHEFVKQKDFFSGPLLPSEVKDILKDLWENEVQLCSFISHIQHQGLEMKEMKDDYSMFFLETILVPPIKFRPPAKGGDSVMEHPQTVLLNKVLQSNIQLRFAHDDNLERSKIVSRWMDLQQSVNVLFDSKTATAQGQRGMASGICQLLEKKEGMFRQKMMGKRVNYSCRSVISPDPYLAVNEIGIPPYFALELTYPERVTPWNLVKLRKAIINGPEIHPGATHYADKLGIKKLRKEHLKERIAISRKLPSSRGLLTQHGKGSDYEFEGKFVRRHLQDGDIVLVNRQPTLHKPSIMAHVVRVLKGEKTLRMHYANCSTYNADFDGDEMNVHFPQDEISRAEAYNIVNANNQYVKPTSGEPIRALIQDHVVSAVLLTKKDTFFSADEFNQLLYCAGLSAASPVSFNGKFGQKVCILNSDYEMQPLLPAIWKPVPLWTGKQVISALLNHITKGRPPFNVEKDAKLPHDFFKSNRNEKKLNKEEKSDKDASKEKELDIEKTSQGKKADKDAPTRKEPDEDKLLIHKNDLVRGVIDKAQFAEYGLVHTVHELYGANTAGVLLSALSRLFTSFLQVHGFTCGVDDLLLMKEKDNEREEKLQDCAKVGEEVHLKFVNDKGSVKIDADVLQLNIEKKIRSNGESALTDLDRKMISKLNEEVSKDFFKELLSRGLLKPSGKNCISLMTTSGAKGASVNFQQISSHLGQQELEGKRVPRMVSGKTLPCFPPWDCAARAGGFIIDRFLTGLHPQEYYFHCMAGREGLVDTAVKTSRSGYLQRCLIKNLECLKICYDHTVRDADGSVIQFFYGEDGIDVHQTSFIAKFEALAANQEIFSKKFRQGLHKSNVYIKGLPSSLEKKAKDFVHKFTLKEKNPDILKEKDFLKLMEHKYISSLAQPGEPVGVLAAQSVGEPSTQMTLNTFHLAGRGEMNVTLGIPRLQEILMTAARDIKTPVMTCPFQVGRSKEDASCLADKLKKITVADIIKSMKVSVVPFSVHDHQICSIYKLEMMLYIPENYPKNTDISLEDWEETLEVVFVRELEDAIQNHLLLLSKISGIKNFVPDSKSNTSNGTDDDDVSGNRSQHEEVADADEDADDGAVSDDLGLDVQKRKQQLIDEMDYDDASEEEPNEGEPSAGSESEIDQAENEIEVTKDDAIEPLDAKDISYEQSGKSSKHKSKDKKNESKAKRKKRSRGKLVKKEYDRAYFVKAKGMHFEIHFRFTNEPHILLAQIAQKTAKKVYIQSFGKIDGCKVVTCQEKQVIFYGKNPKARKDISLAEKEKVPALQATGVDFGTFWQFQDVLDVRCVYSNSIDAMLNTYGVEAARATIIREIQHVFGSYGISVNMRHLTLIADYMTHSGGYRPMNRLGGIANSISPFCKMSFETASKFIVEAASHGETDELESPSARVILGLPVKVGTGSFDVMQKLEI